MIRRYIPFIFIGFLLAGFFFTQPPHLGLCFNSNNSFLVPFCFINFTTFWGFVYASTYFLIPASLLTYLFTKRGFEIWLWYTGASLLLGAFVYFLNLNLWTPGLGFFPEVLLFNIIGAIYLTGTVVITLFNLRK
tara:strand:- start:4247 stop:4648 length:402 start_codon:yes stop_codon:yes gene_type:complete